MAINARPGTVQEVSPPQGILRYLSSDRLSINRAAAMWCTVKGGLVVLVVLMLAACSSGSTTGPSTTSTTTTTGPSTTSTTTTASATATPTINPTLLSKYPGCNHLHDGATATTTKMSNLRGIIYGEISLLCGQAGATMYNTTGLNNQANPNDSAPLLLWNSFSQGTVMLDYEVPGALKNGPRFWVNDWINLPVGPELSFNGLNARWFAYPNYPPGVQKIGVTANAYHTNDISRNSSMGFSSGQSVYILTDPSNNVYVMQAGSQEVNPNESIQSLDTLGSTLTPPQGWKYQVIKLTKELQINAVNGTAKVTIDDQGNAYDQCFETACSYNPVTGQ